MIEEAAENAYHGDGVKSNDCEKMVDSSASEMLEVREDDRVSTYANVVVLTVEARDVLQSSPKHRRMPPMNLLQVDSYAPYLTDAIRVI